MPHIIYISVDGLRSGDATRDLQTLIDSGRAPNFARLQAQGAWTFAARTDPLHTNTLPNHSTMVTARPVEDASGARGHRYRYNDDPEDVPTGGVPLPGVNLSTLHTSAGEYIPSVFNVVHDHGLSTALYASKSKFSLYDASYDGVETAGAARYERRGLARDTTGADNGFDKIDRFFTGSVTGMIDKLLADAAAGGLANYTFVHIASPDSAGHASGWGSAEYLAAIREADAQIGRIFALLDSPIYADQAYLIVSADHGGGGDEPVTDAQHGNPNSPLNFTIPFFVVGPGVDAGADLYALNEPRRDQPAADRNPSILVADATGAQAPIRNGDSANLALDLLGLSAVPTGAINARQDLNVFGVAMRYGTAAGDTMRGTRNADGLSGEGGDDRLNGLAGDDVLKGGSGDDTLDGGLGDDRLNGGDGDDRIVGDRGEDTLLGGGGADSFRFLKNDTGATRDTADLILDFSREDGDLIVLAAIDANARAGGNQRFSFVGPAAFSGKAGELRFEQAGGATFIEADTNGDRIADLVIRAPGSVAFLATDFLL